MNRIRGCICHNTEYLGELGRRGWLRARPGRPAPAARRGPVQVGQRVSEVAHPGGHGAAGVVAGRGHHPATPAPPLGPGQPPRALAGQARRGEEEVPGVAAGPRSGPAERRAWATTDQRAASPAEPCTIRASKLVPVASPTLASGKHHQVSRMGSVVASAAPWEQRVGAHPGAGRLPQEQATAVVRRSRTVVEGDDRAGRGARSRGRPGSALRPGGPGAWAPPSTDSSGRDEPAGARQRVAHGGPALYRPVRLPMLASEQPYRAEGGSP